jgi:Zn-dependent M28 family amino/carboxypeptidase
MKKLLLTLLAVPLLSQAHDGMDWNNDTMGFLSVRYEGPVMTKAMKQNFAPRLDMVFFKEKLAQLSGVNPVTVRGVETKITERKSTKNLDSTREFLKQEYKKLGFKVSFAPFATGSNFIAEKIGTKTPIKVLIVSSHIDSVGNAGANDDGSGTIGLLTVAKELSLHSYGSTIRVLGFDREEVGLKGSDAYVATLPNKADIIGDIHFEMMGYNSKRDGAFHVIDCNSGVFGGNRPIENSLFISKQMKQSIASLDLGLNVVVACTDRSDHASFWKNKIPAIVISENFFGGDGDPCYHAACDVQDERLDYDYMGKILEATLDTTEKLAR